MRARLTWSGDRADRGRSGRGGLRALEWIFLLVGLLAIDCFVWVNTSSVLYQAYEDWAFDQTLRGLEPSVTGFIRDEENWLSKGGHQKVETMQPVAPPIQAPRGVEPPAPAPRSVIGRLAIPRLQLAVMVREGADEGTLSRAVGHIPGTALPGGIGNVGLAGHRDTFFLETTAGKYRYIVKSTRIVTPRDVSVLKASGGETLTLVTCYPFYYVGSAPKRFIVHAALLPEAHEAVASPRHPRQPGSSVSPPA